MPDYIDVRYLHTTQPVGEVPPQFRVYVRRTSRIAPGESFSERRAESTPSVQSPVPEPTGQLKMLTRTIDCLYLGKVTSHSCCSSKHTKICNLGFGQVQSSKECQTCTQYVEDSPHASQREAEPRTSGTTETAQG